MRYTPDAGFISLLADQLRMAEAAHLLHQEEHGSATAAEWPQWYAKYLSRTFGDSYSEEDLLTALLSAATAHGIHEEKTGQHDEKWPEWYAEHMAHRLSREWYIQQAADNAEW
jgi:hypothetical protein